MALRQTKKISELTALTSASLDTTLVGVDGGTTYKIELDTLADAVTSRVNILDRDRLSSLESVTSSFETKGRSVISSSAQITTFGFVSGSYETTGRGIISSSANLVTTSSFNSYTASISTASLVTSISNLNSATSSYLTSLSGAISSSSQLTSSYDTRYVASGSISAVPAGTISGSSQLTSSFDLRYLVTGSVTSSINALNTATSSYETKGRSIVSSSAQITAFGFISSSQTINTASLATTGSNSFNGNQQITGSLLVSQNITGSASASFVSLAVNTTTPTQKIHLKGAVGIENGATMGITADQMIFGYVGSNLTNFTHKIQTGHDAQAALNRMDFLLANSSNTWKTPLQLRPDIVYVSGSLIVTGSINGTINATNGIVSGSSQITYASISSIPAGIVSGSSQTILNLPTGTVSGSSQLTTAFPSKTTGNWTVPDGASTQSFSVESGASYTMWVNGNIPNGIITWNATVTTANTNVPVVGFQHGWYYSAGNALVLTSMPDQITGTNGSIVNIPASYAPNTSNVFKFGITNNSGTSQTINYGYIKLS